MRPMAHQGPWMVRSAALRRCAFGFEKAFSMGLTSGQKAREEA